MWSIIPTLPGYAAGPIARDLTSLILTSKASREWRPNSENTYLSPIRRIDWCQNTTQKATTALLCCFGYDSAF